MGGDVFAFSTGQDRNIVMDFEIGRDMISIDAPGSSGSDVVDTAEGAVISIEGTEIVLKNLRAADLALSDMFLF